MASLGSSSASFLRESENNDTFMEIVAGVFENENNILTPLLQRKANGELEYPKSIINRTMQKCGINKHLIVNALHLQNYNKEDIKDILFGFKEYLEEYGLTGILEVHPNDTTQNSFHIHYYTNDDSSEVMNLLKSYVIQNGYANEDNVDIQGKYKGFKEQEKSLSKKEYKEIVEEAKQSNKEVTKAEVLLPTEEQQEIREIKQSIFDQVRSSIKQTNRAIKQYHESKAGYDKFKEKLSSIPKTNKDERIKAIKEEIKRVSSSRKNRWQYKARSIHNIAIERFFRTLKYNNIYISDYKSIKELKEGVKNWMYKYNYKRFHSSIDYKKPMNVYLNYIESVA